MSLSSFKSRSVHQNTQVPQISVAENKLHAVLLQRSDGDLGSSAVIDVHGIGSGAAVVRSLLLCKVAEGKELNAKWIVGRIHKVRKNYVLGDG